MGGSLVVSSHALLNAVLLQKTSYMLTHRRKPTCSSTITYHAFEGPFDKVTSRHRFYEKYLIVIRCEKLHEADNWTKM